MENKYYTPDIEDIRVGYECEANTYNLPFDGVKSWKSYKFQQQDFNVPIKHLPEYIRTPYLTKEQIKNEGWELDNHHLALLDFSKENNDEFLWKLNKNNTLLWLWQNTHEIKLSKMDYSRETTRDYGFKDDFFVTFKCPSINEFRTICKLLNIN